MIDVEGFGEVIQRPFAQTLDRQIMRAVRRDHDHRRRFGAVLQFPQERDPVHLRHINVADDDIRIERRLDFERVAAVGSQRHLVSYAIQSLAHRLARGFVIVH